MKIEELLYKYKDCDINETKFIELLDLKQKSSNWKPKIYEKFYFISGSDGEVYQAKREMIDFYGEKTGNFFKTREEAERIKECLKIRTEMLELGGRTEFRPNESNWVISYAVGTSYKLYIYPLFSQRFNPFEVYFDSKEKTKKIVEEIGEERLLKYWFGGGE